MSYLPIQAVLSAYQRTKPLRGLGKLPLELGPELTRIKYAVESGSSSPEQAFKTLDALQNYALDEPNYPTYLAQIETTRAYVASFQVKAAQILAEQNKAGYEALKAELARRKASGEDQAEIDAEQAYLRRMALYNQVTNMKPPEIKFPEIPWWVKGAAGVGIAIGLVKLIR